MGRKRALKGVVGSSSPLLLYVGSETLGATLVFLCLIPLCGALDSNNFFTLSLIVHAVGVITVDILSAATIGPHICLGFLLMGRMPLLEALARGVSSMLLGFACTLAASLLGLMDIPTPAPAKGVSLNAGFACEASLSCAFFLVILWISTVIPSFQVRRPIVAATLRVLMTIGGPVSGAYLNPMVAVPFAWYNDALTSDLYVVYVLGPVCGVFVGIIIWSAIQVKKNISNI
jgi:glycerol uptake facilitator-like aquaporin